MNIKHILMINKKNTASTKPKMEHESIVIPKM